MQKLSRKSGASRQIWAVRPGTVRQKLTKTLIECIMFWVPSGNFVAGRTVPGRTAHFMVSTELSFSSTFCCLTWQQLFCACLPKARLLLEEPGVASVLSTTVDRTFLCTYFRIKHTFNTLPCCHLPWAFVIVRREVARRVAH